MSTLRKPVRIWGVIPAAGMSRRMGKSKQVLPFGQSTMVATVTRTLLEAGLDGVVIVTRTALIARLELPADPRVRLAINDDPESEMIDSVRIGLASLRRTEIGGHSWPVAKQDGVLVIPADMPGVRAATCQACVAAYLRDPTRIVIATHAGRRGHPIIFPLTLKPTVDRLEGGLRTLLHELLDRVVQVDTPDPGVTRDINTPEDYGRDDPAGCVDRPPTCET